MHATVSRITTIAGAAVALPLLSAAVPAATEMNRSEFVSGCVGGALGIPQSQDACTCAYDFLTTEASEAVREAMFIRVREGEAAQSAYLEQRGEEVMTELAEDGDRLIGDCGLTDE